MTDRSPRAARLRRPLARTTVAVAVSAVLLAAYWQLRWMRRETERERRSARIAQLGREVRAAEITLQKRPEFRREVEMLDAKLQTLDAILPAQPRLDELKAKLAALGAGGVEIVGWVPGKVVAKEAYSEVPFELRLRGPWPALVAFVSRLPLQPRLMMVTGVTIDVAAEGACEGTIKATAYVFQSTF